MSDTNWAPPTGPPITSKRLDPKMAMASVGAVAALVIGVVVAMNVGGGDGDTNGSSGSGRQYMFGGVVPLEVLGDAPSQEPARQWEYDGNDERAVHVALGKESVFVAGESADGRCTIHALSTDDGKERWSEVLADAGGECGPILVTDDRLLASVEVDDDVEVISFTADKGKEQGRSTVRNGSVLGALLVADPDEVHAYLLLFGPDDPKITRLDLADARRSWSVTGDVMLPGRDGLVVWTDDEVQFVDYDTGDILWDVPSDSPRGFPVGDRVLVDDDGDLVAFDAEGTRTWTIESSAGSDVDGALEAFGDLAVFDRDGTISVRTTDDGEELARGTADGAPLFGGDDGRTVFADDTTVSLLRRDGDEIVVDHELSIDGRTIGSAKALIVVDADRVRALDPQSFEERWVLDEDLDVRVVDHEAMVSVDDEKVTYWR